jgi:Flp pilus assembly protein TadB
MLAYPASFRRRFADEMALVFRDCCRDAYRQRGVWGIVLLLPPTLIDVARSAFRQRFLMLLKTLLRGNPMVDIPAFDSQLGNAVTAMSLLRRAGYSVKQCFEQIAAQAPEPLASIFKSFLDDLSIGQATPEALDALLKRAPSDHLRAVINTMNEQRQTGGNLAVMLEPFGPSIRNTAGSDENTQTLLDAVRELTQAP